MTNGLSLPMVRRVGAFHALTLDRHFAEQGFTVIP